MPTKDSYQQRVNARIEAIHEAMEHHERHLESTESTSKDENEAALQRVKAKRSRLDELLKELEEAGENAWKHLCEHIDEALDEISEAAEHARKRMEGKK